MSCCMVRFGLAVNWLHANGRCHSHCTRADSKLDMYLSQKQAGLSSICMQLIMLHLPLGVCCNMCRYKAAGTPQRQLEVWFNLRQRFEQACMDFVNLQHLDYDAGISCNCGNGAGVIADGLTLGHALHRAHFVTPWGPASQQQPTCGSLFSARVAINDKVLRQVSRSLNQNRTFCCS